MKSAGTKGRTMGNTQYVGLQSKRNHCKECSEEGREPEDRGVVKMKDKEFKVEEVP